MSTKRVTLKAQRVEGSARTGAQAVSAAQRAKNRKRGFNTGRMVASLPAYLGSFGTEIKAIDIARTGYIFRTPAAASAVALLNGIQTGTGFFNRIGSRIEMKSLHVRGTISNIATGTDCQGRILIIYDRQPTGALPVITSILQGRDQTGAAATSGLSEINLDNRDRYIVIRDMQFDFPSVTNTAGVLTNGPNWAGQDPRMTINEFIKLKGLVTHFSGTANPATISEIATGALYIVTVAELNDSTWQANLNFRLRFGDV